MESPTPNPQRNSIPDPQTELHSSINGESLDYTDPYLSFEDVDSSCSTPYVSAPSSPTRSPVSGFFYSAPASPMHFAITKNPSLSSSSSSMDNHSSSFEFDFSSRFASHAGSTSMTSADELFHDGKIRPMKLSTHLEFPLPPLLDLEIGDEDGDGIVEFVRGRDLRLRDKFQRRRTRSMSPLRNSPIEWREEENGDGSNVECSVTADKEVSEESEVMEKVEGVASNSEASTPSISASSSRSSSSGRNSKRWVFLKDFLYRSKSEGRSNNNFWSNISFTPVKEKKSGGTNQSIAKQKFINPLVGRSSEGKKAKGAVGAKKNGVGKPANGVGKRRVPPSPHERHYTANRAYSEEMKKKTYLPYRPGLLGCLGFSSKGYGAVNGFTRALNSVSSR
ncbi:uncharacterized protein LOC101219146 [Cucumis sativus]|uniref:Calmodulin-binding protein n=1 Tax=Cucumis sativus TaxID=3659 RepID=A0A0A0LWA6_CUCSA|nr:uncharacterized protein LOC101219146 [Cucumis sativus]